MNRLALFTAALAVTIGFIVSAEAQGPMGNCTDCMKTAGGVTADQGDPYRKFLSDTIDLRQAMMIKRFELQRENLKAIPDAVKVAGLKADVGDIKARISKIRVQTGLTETDKRDGECVQMWDCGSMPCSGKPCLK